MVDRLQDESPDGGSVGGVRVGNNTQITQPGNATLIPVNCCVDDGTGNCATPGICEQYLTIDGQCPTLPDDVLVTVDAFGNIVDDGSLEGGRDFAGITQEGTFNQTRRIPGSQIRLIACDPDSPPSAVNFTLSASPVEGGSATGRPAGTTSFTNNFSTTEGNTVLIEAVVASGYRFEGWFENGTLRFTSTRLDITADRNYNLVARFSQIQEPSSPQKNITISTNIGGEVSFDGTSFNNNSLFQSFSDGSIVRIYARSLNGFEFDGWVRIGTDGTSTNFSSDLETTVIANEEYNLRAIFREVGAPEPPDEIDGVPDVPPTPPSPQQWRSCIDGELNDGTPPTGYVRRTFTGIGGGVCWEPSTSIGFNPSLNNINFSYQRGSSNFPAPFEFEVDNPSNSVSYEVTFETNSTFFTITPRRITIGPRETSQKINIEVNRNNIGSFGDGLTNFELDVRVEEI